MIESSVDTLVRELIDRGAHVNYADLEGWTPIMFAAIGDKTEVFQVLLRNGANISRKQLERIVSKKEFRDEILALYDQHETQKEKGVDNDDGGRANKLHKHMTPVVTELVRAADWLPTASAERKVYWVQKQLAAMGRAIVEQQQQEHELKQGESKGLPLTPDGMTANTVPNEEIRIRALASSTSSGSAVGVHRPNIDSVQHANEVDFEPLTRGVSKRTTHFNLRLLKISKLSMDAPLLWYQLMTVLLISAGECTVQSANSYPDFSSLACRYNSQMFCYIRTHLTSTLFLILTDLSSVLLAFVVVLLFVILIARRRILRKKMRAEKDANASGKSSADSVEDASEETDGEGVRVCVCTVSMKCAHIYAHTHAHRVIYY